MFIMDQKQQNLRQKNLYPQFMKWVYALLLSVNKDLAVKLHVRLVEKINNLLRTLGANLNLGSFHKDIVFMS